MLKILDRRIWAAIGGAVILAASALPALAATEQGVSATVTPQLVSLTITTNGSVAYGTLAANTSQDTTTSGVDDTETVQNNGNVNEDFDIRSSDAVSAGTDWDLELTTGSDQYVHEFSTDNGTTYTNFPADNSNTSLAGPVAASASQSFDLKITTANPSTNLLLHTITVTVQATATP